MGAPARLIRRALVAWALLLAAAPASAQPVGGQILDRVAIRHEGECFHIAVVFTLPMRYVSHFPLKRGDEVRIEIRPVVTGSADRGALESREAAMPRVVDGLPLIDVVYEGDIPGGPFLRLHFDEVVDYRVRQGGDFRSIVIDVSPPGDGCPLADDRGR